MKTTTRFVSQRTLLVPVILTIAGCYQPYYQTPYGPYQSAPYGAQPAPYGAPSYGTPAPMGSPYGQGVPTGSLPPSTISSMPGDTYYPPPSNGNDAPPFGAQPSQPNPNSGDNSVPRYNDPTSSNNSPYFEKQSNFRPEPEEQTGMVAQANFAAEEPQSAGVEQTSVELFEPPIVTSRSQTPAETPAMSEPQPANDLFELQAPPLSDPKTASSDNALEGTVRRNPQTGGLMLEFAPGPNGQLQLTGAPEVLKGLQEGSRYRVQGFIEAGSSPNMQSQFHLQRYEPLNAAPATKSPFE